MEFENESQNSPKTIESRSSSDSSQNEEDEKYDRPWYHFWENLRDTETHQFEIKKLRNIRREAEELLKDRHYALKFFASLRWVSLYDTVIKLHLDLITKEKKRKEFEFKLPIGTGPDESRFIRHPEKAIVLMFLVLQNPLLSRFGSIMILFVSSHFKKR